MTTTETEVKQDQVKITDKLTPLLAFSDHAIRHNFSAVEYNKTFVSALSGSCAGIIGLTGINGFVFYFLSALILWLMILNRAGLKDWTKYFTQRQILLTNGLFDGLFTYVLFWTFLYGMVHVY